MDASSDTCARIDPSGASRRIAQNLLAWYDVHARDLPWRAKPGSNAPDPYHVWLSEVMLQQTTVAAVKSYFTAFTTRWPQVEDLAGAPDEEIMAAWAGLGYYARARNLVACAREVVANGGRFPKTEEGLRALPGLGAYTAAAVAAIAFGERAVVVDANVERVVSRLFLIEEPLPGGRTAIRSHTDQITPDVRSGDFAQAMMDLGATVCTPRKPSCLLCPLAQDCAGLAAGEPERLPIKAPKKAKPQRQGQAFWIERDVKNAPHVWLVKREGKGMLGGMRALPDDGWVSKNDGSGNAPIAGDWEHVGAVDHVFTHFSLKLGISVYQGDDITGLSAGEWWPLYQLSEAGLPTLFAKAAALALEYESKAE